MKSPLRFTALFFATTALFACQAGIKFGEAEYFPKIGLELPLPDRSSPDPLPLPEAHVYLPANLSDTLVREDRFQAYELWYGEECCARWRDDRGNSFVVGKVSKLFPDFPQDGDGNSFVSRQAYSLEMARAKNLVDPKKREEVNKWVAAFVPASVWPPEKRDVNSFALSETLCYSNDANMVVYAFLPRKVGNEPKPGWFCAAVEYSSPVDWREACEEFEEEFLSKISPPSRNKEKGHAAQEIFPDGKKKAEAFAWDPVREEAKKSIGNYSQWWIAETERNVILGDVYTETGKGLLRDLQKRLPLLQKAYAKLLPPIDIAARDVSVIRVFQSRDGYVQHVGEEMAWSGAVWMPQRRELVLCQESGGEELSSTIQHEAFHQYLSFAYAFLQPAPWFNEGHACLFEGATMVNEKKLLLDPDVNRFNMLLDNLDLATERLPWLLSADYEQFYSGTDADRLLNYATAWGVCYYLQKGLPAVPSPRAFYEILPRYTAALRKTRDGRAATVAAFEGIEPALFQENFRDFWTNKRERAFSYNPLED